MPPFVFNTTKSIQFGAGSLGKIGELALSQMGKRVFLVTDAGMIATGIVDKALGFLKAADVEVTLFSDVQADPPESVILAAAQAAADAGAKGVIGLGGIGTHPEDLSHMRRTADRLFGGDYQWSILGAGSSQLRLASLGAAMGSNVRVGLEDSLWGGPGKLAESSAEQVLKIREVLSGLSLEVATPGEEAQAIAIALRESHRRGGARVDLPLQDRSLKLGGRP